MLGYRIIRSPAPVLTCELAEQLGAHLSHGFIITALHEQRLVSTDPAAQHVAIALGRVKHIEAADFAVPELFWISQALQLCLILPHELDAVALGAPEGLRELQEDLIRGADAQLLDGQGLVLGQAWREKRLVGFL